VDKSAGTEYVVMNCVCVCVCTVPLCFQLFLRTYSTGPQCTVISAANTPARGPYLADWRVLSLDSVSGFRVRFGLM